MPYDLIACPHRVSMGLFANPAKQDDLRPFVQMLRKRGASHEQEIMRSEGMGPLCLPRRWKGIAHWKP
jgi:hypothetical protein